MMMNRKSRFTGKGSSRGEVNNDGMRIFIAGASGVIGQRLIPLLVRAGHVVGGMTRSPSKTELLRNLGAEPILCDVFDREALIQAVRHFKPDIILNELTDLPDDVAKIGEHAVLNARIRTEGNQNLIEAARQSGSPKILAQSVAWQLADRPDARAIVELERSVLAVGGVVMRYGQLYGPGTYNEGQLPAEPRVQIDRAAERTVEALGKPTGVVVISDPIITSSKPMLVLAFLITCTLITTSPLMAQKSVKPPIAQETISELMSKDLAGSPGQEIRMYTVDFPPGFSSPVHRHNAQVAVYVLEGSVVMQVRGGKEVTLQPGQSFYEDPSDIHVVSRNASSTKPARFLVFLIHKKGEPLVIPAK
jgi:quercetin dioxygenase-like cupin family protein/NAD(P)-dependent dehydrogenase (short-subunit alcohol dehydrogenase family)